MTPNLRSSGAIQFQVKASYTCPEGHRGFEREQPRDVTSWQKPSGLGVYRPRRGTHLLFENC